METGVGSNWYNKQRSNKSTISCRYQYIRSMWILRKRYFVVMSFLAGISSFLGLFIGIGGLVFTLWTWFKADSIKKILVSTNSKHLLVARSSDYIRQLKSISKKITDLVKNEDETQQRRFVSLCTESREVCRSIRNKVDTIAKSDHADQMWYFASLRDLEQTNQGVDLLKQSDKDLILQNFLQFALALMHEIDQSAKDRRSSI